MIIKLWIIHKSGIGFSKIIAETLRELLEANVDVDVGSAKKINPTDLFEEKIDYLIIGDVITQEIPSLEIQGWLSEYREISEKCEIHLKVISGFYITLADITSEPIWAEFIQRNVKTEIVHPPILHLKLNREELALEKVTYDLIKQFSSDIVKYI